MAEEALATGGRGLAGRTVLEAVICRATGAETGMPSEVAAGDTTDRTLAVAVTAAPPAWGLEEASVEVVVVPVVAAGDAGSLPSRKGNQ